jgi:hypothetical protein
LGHITVRSAGETLNVFMRHGTPNPHLFAASVGPLVSDLAEAGRPLRIYGEMVRQRASTTRRTSSRRFGTSSVQRLSSSFFAATVPRISGIRETPTRSAGSAPRTPRYCLIRGTCSGRFWCDRTRPPADPWSRLRRALDMRPRQLGDCRFRPLSRSVSSTTSSNGSGYPDSPIDSTALRRAPGPLSARRGAGTAGIMVCSHSDVSRTGEVPKWS